MKKQRAGTILTYLLVELPHARKKVIPGSLGLELAFTQRRGKGTGRLVHSPIPPTVGQLSVTSSQAAPAFCSSDSNRKGSHSPGQWVSQWQSRKSHWGRNSGLLWQDWQTTPTPGQHLGGPALLEFWSMKQERSLFRRLHTILISRVFLLTKTCHGLLLPKASHLNSLA